MEPLLRPRPVPGAVSLGLLLLRVVAGVALVLHSFSKLEEPTGWLPGSPFPGWALAIGAYAELIGGTLFVLGLVTPLAGLLVAGVMAGAVYYHVNAGHPFVGSPPSFELALVYGLIGVVVLLAGPGDMAVDRALFREKGGG